MKILTVFIFKLKHEYRYKKRGVHGLPEIISYQIIGQSPLADVCTESILR